MVGFIEARLSVRRSEKGELKGDTLRQETYKYLSQMQGINFVGNVEGRDINYGNVDVVIADGFSGNVALTSIEG